MDDYEMLQDYPDILTPQEVMEILGIHRGKFYELVNSGELLARQIGKKGWRVTKVNLIKFVEK